MKKLWGKKEKNDKKTRPSSASDSTLQVPLQPLGFAFTRSTERVTTTSSSYHFSSSSTTSTATANDVKYGGTFPRHSYNPVYERTKELSQKFDRASPSRHSTTPTNSVFSMPQSPRNCSIPSTSHQWPTPASYSRPPPSPLTMQPSERIPPIRTDARPFTPVVQFTPRIVQQNVSSNNLESMLNVKVKKCIKPKDYQTERIPTYKTNTSGKRGSLLVINNIKFQKNEKERKGAEKDVQNIKELFRQMNFDTTVRTNLKKSEMESELKNYSKKNLRQYDVNVVVMMSHGCGDAASNSTQITGTDGHSLPTSNVVEYFTNAKCPSLVGKPKIFIFQCCRGNQECIYTDATSLKTNREGDMLLAYATIPGFVSYRQEFIGSWYIQAICTVFMDNAHNTHVEDMLKMVDGVLANKASQHNRAQTSSYENRGFKCCYLNPI